MPKRAQTRQELFEAGKARWTAEDARQMLAAQEASGESTASFARRHGLQAQRLSWWRNRGATGAKATRRRCWCRRW